MVEREKKLLKERWDNEHEKQLEEVLSKNEELRKLFEKYPERKTLYKLKILDSEVAEAPTPPDNICCKTCVFQLPPISIGGQLTSRCNWGQCTIVNKKPFEVLYEGAQCEFYEKEKK